MKLYHLKVSFQPNDNLNILIDNYRRYLSNHSIPYSFDFLPMLAIGHKIKVICKANGFCEAFKNIYAESLTALLYKYNGVCYMTVEKRDKESIRIYHPRLTKLQQFYLYLQYIFNKSMKNVFSKKNFFFNYVICMLVSTVGKCCGMLWYV